MLDRTRPYDTVGGLSGACYMQDGRLFNAGGMPVDMHTRTVTGRDDDGKEWQRDENFVTAATMERQPEPKVAATGYRAKHWRELKALVEQYDHEWTNKEDAVRFLEMAAA